MAVLGFLTITVTPISHSTPISGINPGKRLQFIFPGLQLLEIGTFNSASYIILDAVLACKLTVMLLRRTKSKISFQGCLETEKYNMSRLLTGVWNLILSSKLGRQKWVSCGIKCISILGICCTRCGTRLLLGLPVPNGMCIFGNLKYVCSRPTVVSWLRVDPNIGVQHNHCLCEIP